MKYWLSHLPLEVWVDCYRYPGISREQMGQIVDLIGNHNYGEYLQFYLHDWGKRTLKALHLYKKAVIPRTPMPENIKLFENIQISHFDSAALAFLRIISTLFLTNDVNLRLGFNDDMTNLSTVLDHLSPMLHGIHSLRFKQNAIPLVEQYFAPKLAQIKMLTLHFGLEQLDPATLQASINFCLNWLVLKEWDPAEPRLLGVHICYVDKLQQFCMAIREQFLTAKSPATFAILLKSWDGSPEIDNFQLENSLSEQLHGQFNGFCKFQINRHQPNAGTALQEWVEQTFVKSHKSSRIAIDHHVTIGQIEANDAEEEQANQPSASKKPN